MQATFHSWKQSQKASFKTSCKVPICRNFSADLYAVPRRTQTFANWQSSGDLLVVAAAQGRVRHHPTNQRGRLHSLVSERYEQIQSTSRLMKTRAGRCCSLPVRPCVLCPTSLHLERLWPNVADSTTSPSFRWSSGSLHICLVPATIETLRPPAWFPEPPLEGGTSPFRQLRRRALLGHWLRSRRLHSPKLFIHLSRRRHSLSRRHAYALPRMSARRIA